MRIQIIYKEINKNELKLLLLLFKIDLNQTSLDYLVLNNTLV